MAFRKRNAETEGKGATARSRILREITILLVAVMIASGLAIFFVVRRSQESLIENYDYTISSGNRLIFDKIA